ncbi:ribosomal RNA-processing protein [Diaporthe helianthi]|uniref:Ribosomal RNA-processing protein n=1 Tax=Diaporthe helianthi TaxID=158607 RepID=A0A2P5HTB7_DIAHE|nr:ribosomal RNA-processing protein [Diaporthe helianthi]
MASTTYKKRSRDDGSRSKAAPLLKKQKKKQQQQQAPSRGDESDDAQEFQAVNLLDSDDDDIYNAQVDDGGDSGSDADSIGSSSSSEDERPRAARTKPTRPQPIARDVPANKLARDAPGSKSKSVLDDGEDQSGDDDQGENDEYLDLDDEVSSDEAGGDAHEDHARLRRVTKSKRNDPEAFSTSMSKILGTKISGKNRADPVLARSADARERVRQVLDEDLDRKARRKLREQKQRAMEKGRVRDVLVATNATFSNVNPVTGKVVSNTDGETTADILATERRLRKVAQRGVVQLFNAFRTAQVKAAEAERLARKQGVIGMDNKKDKVTEMSKKGFLDLIASGGGGLKKGPMEEA